MLDHIKWPYILTLEVLMGRRFDEIMSKIFSNKLKTINHRYKILMKPSRKHLKKIIPKDFIIKLLIKYRKKSLKDF